MILPWILFLPSAMGLLAWWMSVHWKGVARYVAMIGAGMYLVLLLIALFFQGPSLTWFYWQTPWIPEWGISLELAMDGLNYWFLLVAGLLFLFSILCSWEEQPPREGFYYCNLLLLLTALSGVFLAQDLFLFYLFWELMIVPLYFLVTIWGRQGIGTRAALKLFLYTQASGLLLFAGIVALYFLHGKATGHYTFQLSVLSEEPVRPSLQGWLLLLFFIGFLVKLPGIPLHGWLPDAHEATPEHGGVDAAGLVLKVGGFAMLRYLWALFPDGMEEWRVAGYLLGIGTILYGAWLAYGQQDLKRLVAYASVSHMGFVLLGVTAGTESALLGAALLLLVQSVVAGVLFALIGQFRKWGLGRHLKDLGGLWDCVPRAGGFSLFFLLALLGLPGMGTFVGEFLVLLGVWQEQPWIAAVAALGVVFSVTYALRMADHVLFGECKVEKPSADLRKGLVAAFSIAVAVLLVTGLYPKLFLETIEFPFRKAGLDETSAPNHQSEMLVGIENWKPTTD